MKVIGLNASPRVNGNSDIFLDKVLKGASDNGAEVAKFYLDKLNIEPCHACEHCGDGIDCKNNDDGNMLLDEILSADAIVFSSPIYYGQMSAQGKTFTDRFYSISRNSQKSLEGTKSVLLFAQGAPAGTYDQYIELTKASPFSYVGMDVIDTLTAGDIHESGEIKENTEILDKAYEIGKSL
ncbi:flavodoxin family protein [Methanobrevibacter sp. OttesenSCG-928-K11]|nr:flavodoxin family protein [Methanobrevibacter sp. OttesenSCG-928-K11]MDL2270487.1 flavodoxin family protein [Methanobrevibacter sp. OttesenSCG-928-I08]